VKRWLPLLSALVLSALSVAGVAAWQQYQDFLETPLTIPAEGTIFQLEPGASGSAIVAGLSRQGLTRPGWEWRLLMRLEPHVYRVGEYRLEPKTGPSELLALLSSGRVVQHRFTLVEGWSFRQLAAALIANPVLRHELDLDAPAQWDLVTAALGIDHPEGWFLPETYQFTRGDSDRDILQRAHRAMKAALEKAWASRDPALPLDDPYQLLTLASIIEKETARESERGQVAGVFVRRLRKGMRLQTDPTVIYGMGEAFDGDIRHRDLRTDTPYNTYTRHGLPPTPIAMPGRASLAAAARPESGETLYFVADGSGGHTFSKTLEEHQEAVRKLIERR
jgi:UPF0755 protein